VSPPPLLHGLSIQPPAGGDGEVTRKTSPPAYEKGPEQQRPLGYATTGPQLDPELTERCRRLALLRLACIHGDLRLAALAMVDRPV